MEGHAGENVPNAPLDWMVVLPSGTSSVRLDRGPQRLGFVVVEERGLTQSP
jgi:hypothetical protein